MGKNQVKIKDNHGHVTKVHHRDVKKIPMTEKVCKQYEEEQTGKTREGRKAVPNSKMPDLAWDIADTQLTQGVQKENIIKNIKDSHRTLTSTITLATNMTNCTKHKEQVQINNKTARYSPGMRKLNDEYDESY